MTLLYDRDGQGSGWTVGGNFGNFYDGGIKAILRWVDGRG